MTPSCRLLVRFNSRPCEGATAEEQKKRAAINVSIHAPVKERPQYRIKYLYLLLFQFTPL